jgi:hypothetical protein
MWEGLREFLDNWVEKFLAEIEKESRKLHPKNKCFEMCGKK